MRFHLAQNKEMAKRNARMIELYTDGHSCAAIARFYGLSGSRVWQIVRWNGRMSTVPQNA